MRFGSAHLRASIDSGNIHRAACARVVALRTGDPLLPDTEVGPLIHPRETARVESWVEEARAAGARMLGGGRYSETTLLPSVLVEPPADAKVSQLEIFGPVTCVYGFDELDRAIEIANALPFAFQASVFSKDRSSAQVAQRVDASTVLINDQHRFPHRLDALRGPPSIGLRHGRHPRVDERHVAGKMIVLRHDA